MSAAAHRIEIPDLPTSGGIASWLAEFEISQEAPRFRIDPELSVEVIEHAVATAHGPRPGTSYITRGLARVGQPEVVVTWSGPRLLGTPTAAIVAALRGLGRAVDAGLTLRAGTGYHLGDGALLDGVGLAGLVFVPAQAMPGLAPPAGALHAIAVTGAELALAARTTVHRVASRLGRIYRQFPWPVWSTPRRSVGRADEPSAIASLPRAVVPGLRVGLHRTAVSVEVPTASAAALRAAVVDPDAVLAHGVVIGAEPDVGSDAHLVWLAEPRETIAVSAPHARGTRTAGAFLHLQGGDRVRGLVLEDGLSLVLGPAGRQALCVALDAGKSWAAAVESGEVRVSLL